MYILECINSIMNQYTTYTACPLKDVGRSNLDGIATAQNSYTITMATTGHHLIILTN